MSGRHREVIVDLIRAWAAGLAVHVGAVIVLGTLSQGVEALPQPWALWTARLLGGAAAALAHPRPERERLSRYAVAVIAPAATVGLLDGAGSARRR